MREIIFVVCIFFIVHCLLSPINVAAVEIDALNPIKIIEAIKPVKPVETVDQVKPIQTSGIVGKCPEVDTIKGFDQKKVNKEDNKCNDLTLFLNTCSLKAFGIQFMTLAILFHAQHMILRILMEIMFYFTNFHKILQLSCTQRMPKMLVTFGFQNQNLIQI
jgi:hypothetical protein